MDYIGITKQLRIISAAYANIDANYGPFASIEDALQNIPRGLRKRGLTLGIIEGEMVKEFWFNGGIDEEHLISKGSEVDFSTIISLLDSKVDVEQDKFLMTLSERNFIEGLVAGGAVYDNKYLSKVNPDTAAELIKFAKGLTVGEYTPGLLGGGASFKMEDGISKLEVDQLTVRMQALFHDVYIKRAQHIDGELVLSPANMVCINVEDKGDFYRCYFNDAEGKVPNTFKVGDFARAQTFGIPLPEVDIMISESDDVIVSENGEILWMD